MKHICLVMLPKAARRRLAPALPRLMRQGLWGASYGGDGGVQCQGLHRRGRSRRPVEAMCRHCSGLWAGFLGRRVGLRLRVGWV